jgi:hypothetical protein
MFQSVRLLLVPAVVVGFLAGGYYLTSRPSGGGQSREEDDVPHVMGEMAQEQLHSLQLDGRREAGLARLTTKRQIGADLATGKLSLLEAAARLRDMNRSGPPSILRARQRHFPGLSEEELSCREAIGWVENWLAEDPSRDRSLIGRLEAELSEHLRRGKLVLPGPGKRP